MVSIHKIYRSDKTSWSRQRRYPCVMSLCAFNKSYMVVISWTRNCAAPWLFEMCSCQLGFIQVDAGIFLNRYLAFLKVLFPYFTTDDGYRWLIAMFLMFVYFQWSRLCYSFTRRVSSSNLKFDCHNIFTFVLPFVYKLRLLSCFREVQMISHGLVCRVIQHQILFCSARPVSI